MAMSVFRDLVIHLFIYNLPRSKKVIRRKGSSNEKQKIPAKSIASFIARTFGCKLTAKCFLTFFLYMFRAKIAVFMQNFIIEMIAINFPKKTFVVILSLFFPQSIFLQGCKYTEIKKAFVFS